VDRRSAVPPGIWPFSIIALAVLLAFAIGGGFVGADDLHYLRGALRYLKDGTYIPYDHWEARLPYIASIATAVRIFGPNENAFMVPNAVFLTVTLLLCWRIGMLATGSAVALLAVVMAAATPLFLRSVKTFYPESIEVVLTAGMVTMVLAACWNERSDSGRRILLVGAGLLGGTAILVRETALAVPIATSLVIMWEHRRSPAIGIRHLAWTAVGTVLPLALECFYYLRVTGNPFYRFALDSRHVLIPSGYLVGRVFTGSPLFNWKLGALWAPPALFHLHWTVNPLLNFFTHPGLLFLPSLGVAGAVVAWNQDGRQRTLAVLALGMLFFQYLINTFVLVVAPNPRYFADSAFVLCLTAGCLLAALRVPVRALLLSLVLLLSAAIDLASFDPDSLMASLNSFVRKEPVVHVSQAVANTAYLSALTNPDLATGLIAEPASVGDYAAIGWIGDDRKVLSEICDSGGEPRWQTLDTGVDVHSFPWKLLKGAGLLNVVPAALRNYLSRDVQAITLVRRKC
jgi:4-amino-4-deoxy-L-arabinose transferase-like glycosyltransferase